MISVQLPRAKAGCIQASLMAQARCSLLNSKQHSSTMPLL
jgi:hypothetical protein